MTTAIDIDRFLPFVRLYAHPLPDPVAERFMREAAREFCKTTKCWRETDTITITTPAEELLCPTADAEIIEIERADMGSPESPLQPVTLQDLDDLWPTWRTDSAETDESNSTYITQLSPTSFTLVPGRTGTITFRMILKPSIDAVTLPEFLLREHANQLGKGAASMALMVPGTEYSNPQAASMFAAEFDEYKSTQKWELNKTKVKARTRTRPNWF